MGVTCEDVRRELSAYLSGDLDAARKQMLEEHFAACGRCKSLLDGMSNVATLYGDERLAPLPPGFHSRLRNRLVDDVEGQKGSVFGWVIAAAAFGALAASILLATAQARFAPQLRAKMSQPVRKLPDKLVAVVEDGKTFHVPGCTFMHGKYRMITAEEAVREGYSQCVRCMKYALESAGNAPSDTDEEPTSANAVGGR